MIRRLWAQVFVSDDSRSRRISQQLVITVLLGTAITGHLVSRPALLESAQLWAGAALLLAATVGTLVVPWPRLPDLAAAALPVANACAIGLVRLATLPDGATLSFLMFLPAVWLVINHRVTGIMLAVGTTLAVVTAPGVFAVESPSDPLQVARYFLLPIVVLYVTVMIHGLYTRLRATQRRTAQLSRTVQCERDQARQTARLLRSIVESLGIGVLVVDVDGTPAMSNRALQQLDRNALSTHGAEFTAAHARLYHGDGATPIEPPLHPAARATRGEVFDDVVVRLGERGAGQKTLSITARSVPGERGERTGSVLAVHDITPMAEAMRAREEFLASVSHELRTPLTSIIGYLELAADEAAGLSDGGARVQGHLAVAERNCEQLLGLVEDLLVEQSSQIGSFELRPGRHRLSVIAIESVQSFAPAAADRSISLTDRCAETPEAALDPIRMRQVCDNLIANAIKYTEPGGSVTVSTRARGSLTELEVSDDGPGLNADDAARVFEPFYRTATSRRSNASGAGLGLSIVRRIITAHGGDIVVESAVGHGSSFRVTLPLGEGGTAAASAGTTTAPIPPTDGAHSPAEVGR